MAVSISRIRKDIEEIKKTLGERITLYVENSVEITREVNKIIGMYRDSELYLLNEAGLPGMDLDRLTEILKDAVRINTEYEIFLKMVGLSRID
jgi:hypothetical protein